MQLLTPNCSYHFPAVSFCCITTQAQAPNPGFTVKKGDRIILLVNASADRTRHYGYLEAILQKYFFRGNSDF